MKKILISILTILGIGLSFCSADGIYHNPDLGLISIISGGNTVYTLQDKNLGATTAYDLITPTSDSCGNYYQYGNNYGFNSGNYTYTSSNRPFNNSYDSAGPGNYYNSSGTFYFGSRDQSNGVTNLNIWGSVDGTFLSTKGPCPDGFHLPFDFESIKSYILSVYPGSNYLDLLLIPKCGYINSSSISSFGSRVYSLGSVFPVDSNKCKIIYNSNFRSSTSYCSFGVSVRCFKNDVVEPDYTWSVLYGDIIEPPSNPKFKVNYGDTSYEYELSDNLEIYLKSPVVMSGTTDYIYAGSTGINLFFNGTSQFYNKSELYLNTPSWYNNNIFTPICL